MKGISIRFRLMLLMICLTTLPVITVTWQATNNTRSSVENEMIEANESRMIWASQYVDELIQQLSTLFYSLHIRSELIEELAHVDRVATSERYRIQNELFSTMGTAFYSFSKKIDQLTLYIHGTQRAYSVNYANSGLVHSLSIEKGPWSRLLEEPVGLYFKSTGDELNAYHSMNQFRGQELIGGISVRLDNNVWGQVETILRSEPESKIFLVNDEGELLPGSSPLLEEDPLHPLLANLEQNTNAVSFSKTTDYYLFAKRVSGDQIYMVKAIPSATIDAIARKTMTAGLWTGVVFTAVSILLSIVVSLRISRPIVSLARTMRKSHIHTFEMKSVKSKDEIGLLEAGYNFMMTRMKSLIENEYQQQIEVKNAQLIALQAQINPHFLNNTLHMIGGMALSKGAPEIYRVTHVIGDLLRYAISAEQDQMVCLSDELKHTENYIFIQKQRFAGRVHVTIKADEHAVEVRMPKFTLQPIVENAFEHGLQRKQGEWRLDIRISLIRSRIVLQVRDGGVGIEVGKRRVLRQELIESDRGQRVTTEGHQERRGIGLLNVHARLSIRYGKGYGVRLFSEQGEGTLVVMTMPARSRETDSTENTNETIQKFGEGGHHV